MVVNLINKKLFQSLSILVLFIICVMLPGSAKASEIEPTQLEDAVAVIVSVYDLTISNIGDGDGLVEVNYRDLPEGTIAILNARPDDFSLFVAWQVVEGDINIEDPYDPELAFVVTDESYVIEAYFTLEYYNIAVFTDYGDGGPMDAQFGQAIQTAIVSADLEPLPGYHFLGWQLMTGETTLENPQTLNLTFKMPSENVMVVAYFEPLLYSDIENHKHYTALSNASFGGWLIEIYPEEELLPDEQLTRAEFAVMIKKAFDLGTPSRQKEFPFVDCLDIPASEAIGDLYSLEIISGIASDLFGPDLPVTKEQAVSILVRLLGYLHRPGLEVAQEPVMNFRDIEDISDWALETVTRAYKLNLDQGNPDNTYEPQALLTRAEGILRIMRTLAISRS